MAGVLEEATRLFRKAIGGKSAEERQKQFRRALKIITDMMLVFERTKELQRSPGVMKCLFLSYPISTKAVCAFHQDLQYHGHTRRLWKGL